MRPNFLVIGAQKSATSNLCDLLSRHPDVFLTDPKEPYFFSHDEFWERGWSWYESLFDGAGAATAIGEGSTTYSQQLLYPNACPRIVEHLPDSRLIYLVRHPLDRIQSHWMHLRSRENRETRAFNDAVRESAFYLDHSRYLQQIDRYRAHYPDERIKVLFFEDFRRAPEAMAAEVFRFLGVDDTVDVSERADARHASGEGRVDGNVVAVARRLPAFRAVRDLAPAPVREAMRRVFKKPIGERPEWDDATRAWVIDQLRDESRAFLERYGRSADAWSFDENTSTFS